MQQNKMNEGFPKNAFHLNIFFMMRNLVNFATRQFFSNSAMHKYALGCSNKYAKYGNARF